MSALLTVLHKHSQCACSIYMYTVTLLPIDTEQINI